LGAGVVAKEQPGGPALRVLLAPPEAQVRTPPNSQLWYEPLAMAALLWTSAGEKVAKVVWAKQVALAGLALKARVHGKRAKDFRLAERPGSPTANPGPAWVVKVAVAARVARAESAGVVVTAGT